MTRTVSPDEYRALAEIRYRIRRFLTFSETCARTIGLDPDQHQLLIVLQGLPPNTAPTVSRLAERLQIPFDATLELVSRSTEKGLLRRFKNEKTNEEELEITLRSIRLLEKMSVAHLAELGSVAPVLIDALSQMVEAQRASENSAVREQPRTLPEKLPPFRRTSTR